VIGEKESKNLDSVLLSHCTVKRRIIDLSVDILEQIVNQVKKSIFYSMHLDECTDIVTQQQLSVFIQYVGNDEVSEDLLFCKVCSGILKVKLRFVPMVKQHVLAKSRDKSMTKR